MFYHFTKRLEDIFFAIIILFVFAPAIIIVSFLLLIIEGWPVFYISKRMIKKDKEIKVIKFRTMVKDAKSKKYNISQYMREGYLDVPLSSNVFTKIGRFLEKTQFVEIPQVIHVLFGQLSFIGNRPLPKENIDLLKKRFPKNWYKRFDSPCGMTGISQVVGKFNLNSEQRLELESLYGKVFLKGNVLKADAYIFFSTIILILLRNKSAYRSYQSAKDVLNICLKNK